MNFNKLIAFIENHHHWYFSLQKSNWTSEEHRLFIEAIKLFPKSNWKTISNYVKSKSVRQTLSYAYVLKRKIINNCAKKCGIQLTKCEMVAAISLLCMQY